LFRQKDPKPSSACARPYGSLGHHPESGWLGNSLRSDSPRQRSWIRGDDPVAPNAAEKIYLDNLSNERKTFGKCVAHRSVSRHPRYPLSGIQVLFAWGFILNRFKPFQNTNWIGFVVVVDGLMLPLIHCADEHKHSI